MYRTPGARTRLRVPTIAAFAVLFAALPTLFAAPAVASAVPAALRPGVVVIEADGTAVSAALVAEGGGQTGTTPQERTAEADAAFAAQDWEAASRAYRALVEADASDVRSWFRLGQALQSMDAFEEAANAYQTLLEVDAAAPFAPQARLRLAGALAAQGLDDEALEQFSLFAELGPNRAALTAIEAADEFDGLRGTERFETALALIRPCGTPEYRQFDFWVGEWEVYGPAGQVIGRSVIESKLNGCAIHESWTGGTSVTGHSYNFYDASEGRWHQTWINNSGVPLYLDGELTEAGMVLRNETNRVTWSPLPGGYVRQHWESTTDGGATWTTAFDGEYRPAEGRTEGRSIDAEERTGSRSNGGEGSDAPGS